LEKNCEILERISTKHAKRSKEYKALKLAAFALNFALLKHSEEFEAFMSDAAKPLSKEKKEFLKKIEREHK